MPFDTYRALNPDRPIYIAGDDDQQRATELDGQRRSKINVGRVKADEAAAAIGSPALFPPFAPGGSGTDWNDLAQMQGRIDVADALKTAIAIADREGIVRLLEETTHILDALTFKSCNRHPAELRKRPIANTPCFRHSIGVKNGRHGIQW